MTRRFPQVTLLCPQLLRWPMAVLPAHWRVVTVGLSAIVPLARMYVGAHLPIGIVGGSFLVSRLGSASGDLSRRSERQPRDAVARRSARECDGGAKADRQCISEYPAGGMVDDSAFSVVALVLRRRSVVLGRSRFILRRLDRRRGRDPRYRQNVLHVVREPISSRFYDLPNRASAGIGSDISIGQARAVRATPQLSSPRRCQLTRLGVGV
jgi:hypothetical protein